MTHSIFDLTSITTSKKMRQEFADTMLEVGQKDSNLIVLIGDISHFVLQPYAKACPKRFYNIGICEQTIVNMSAGLSKMGFYPVVHTIAPFIVERSFEQIKLDFGYQKLGVNIITVGSAFDYSALGSTHHCFDDFALLKNVDGMQIIYPASCKEFNLLFKQTYNNGKPTYFRIPEAQHKIEFKDEQILFGKGIIVKTGKDITLIAIGPQLQLAVNTAEELAIEDIEVEILYFPTLKPLDIDLIIESLKKTQKCLVIEEHSCYGGIFDDVLRCSKDLSKVKYESINLGDECIHDYGTYLQLCKKMGFSKENIINKIKKLMMESKNNVKSTKEINLLKKYPRSKRNIDERGISKTEKDRKIARLFGKEFFDGDRSHGYGGFSYNPRFWSDVVTDFIKFYDLKSGSKILDVGCAKGFMLYDFKKINSDFVVHGIDISSYAIENAKDEIKPFLSVDNAKNLSQFKDNEFDLVISINTVHNLDLEECKQAIKEIQRVGKHAFICVDAWRNDSEKEKMLKWNLTAKTLMHVNDWKMLFDELHYTGEYYWFTP